MADSQTEAGNIQNEAEDSCSTRSKEVLKKNKKLKMIRVCQQDTGAT